MKCSFHGKGNKKMIQLPELESNFETIKKMSLDEMADNLIPMLCDILEDGVPSSDLMKAWLEAKPIKD